MLRVVRDDGPVTTDSQNTFSPPEGPELSARAVTLGVSFLASVLLLAGLAVVPSPYVVKSPGPTRDTLGSHDDEELISITDAETYESTGELRMVTVGVSGGPGYAVYAPQVVQGWIDETRAVFPVEEVFPPDANKETVDAANAADMTDSQQSSVYVALEALGYDIPIDLVVGGTSEGTGAAGEVETGDVIQTLDGTAITGFDQLVTALDGIDPGTTVTLGVLRDDDEVDVTFATTAKDADPEASDEDAQEGGSRLGVIIEQRIGDLPVTVEFQTADIGGPSAGMMFALGILDKLTPEDEVNGQVVAGTGTIDSDGDVGPIGGIQQKLYGALRDGAEWFLAPVENCDEVYGHVPDGLKVVKVDTFGEARAAMVAIGAGEGDSLATCTSEDVATAISSR
ncbi:PDZ domain-containing protein [Sanguibacter antarcticus]|uniref:PDZ domain-containing protein n=1 Tax=Sanguibacter antarcticus TaxID=372484 RepID=A0A2A9E4G6_9MICO|nr:PDZ domain-containing protein [Sanguibacter antarcticus]